VAHTGWLEQRDQRKEIEKRNMELERRNIDLNERVNELTSQVLVLVQQQNQLEQQVNILREENAKLAQGAGGGQKPPAVAARSPGVEAATPAATTPIRGRIVEVQGDVATISVGSADGVQKGTVFVIYRGSDYIGDLKITDVEPDLAAGKIVHARATPRPDDMVADEPALGMAQ
jgi:TolA-binding protein